MSESTEKQLDMSPRAGARVVAWEAAEFIERPKGVGWLVGVWVLALVFVGLALWQYQLTFLGIITTLVAIAAALALTTQGRVRPKVVRIVIDADGLIVNGQRYPWQELKSFWLVFTPLNQSFYLETTRRFLPIMPLQIGEMDPEIIRSLLLAHLPERVDRAEELGDRFARMMKF